MALPLGLEPRAYGLTDRRYQPAELREHMAVPRGFEPLSPACLSNHNVDRISSALKSLACFCVENLVPTVQKRVSTVPNTGNI